jgi:lipoate-protein ligase A
MNLEVLPQRTGGAAENMATDFMLLQRYPREKVARYRHYDWRSPAFTFGYSQKIAFVRSQLPAGEALDLCRRPTGGGVVDHQGRLDLFAGDTPGASARGGPRHAELPRDP